MANQSFLRTHPSDMRGKGGRRKGFASPNEIEDMQLFDDDPGKHPSQENGKPPPDLRDKAESGKVRPGGRH